MGCEVLAEWHLGCFSPFFLENSFNLDNDSLGWLVIAIWRDLFFPVQFGWEKLDLKINIF